MFTPNQLILLALAKLKSLGLAAAGASLTLELCLLLSAVLLARALIGLGRLGAKPYVSDWWLEKLALLSLPTLIGLMCWGLALAGLAPIGGHVLNGAALVMIFWLVATLAYVLPGPRPIKWGVMALTALALALVSVNSLRPLLDIVAQLQFTLGDLKISVWGMLKGVFWLGILGWVSVAIAKGIEHALESNETLSPALGALLVKLFKLFAVLAGLLIALAAMGINVTHLAVFGGALGVGIGLSLRSIASNFIGGLFLLVDKSIKPGDVISLDDTTFGQVKGLHSRYVVLRRRDGKEVLIPNEMLMNQPVINWSYSNKAVRSDIDIPVAYSSNMEQVQAVLKDAIKSVPRVLTVPAPIVFIKAFGENGAIFLVRFWSNDPEMGVNNLKGDVNMACWKALRENGIEIPLPQRVYHAAPPPKRAKKS